MTELRHLPFTYQPHLTRQYTHPAVKVGDEDEGIPSVARSEELYFHISLTLRKQRENSEHMSRASSDSGSPEYVVMHTTPRHQQCLFSNGPVKNSMCHRADSCVPDEPDACLPDSRHTDSIGSFSDRGRSTQALVVSPSFISFDFFFFFKKHRLHPFRQQAARSRRALATRTARNKYKLTTPPNGGSCYRSSFICYSTCAILSTYTPPTPPVNEPVRFYHPKGLDTTFFPFFLTTLHILSSACFLRFCTLLLLYSAAFCCVLAMVKGTARCRFLAAGRSAVNEKTERSCAQCI